MKWIDGSWRDRILFILDSIQQFSNIVAAKAVDREIFYQFTTFLDVELVRGIRTDGCVYP